MVKIRLLAALCVGTLCYVLASVTCGRNGMWAENQLNEQKRILSMHTSEIEKKNEELNLEKVALQKDMDVVAAYARKLSYIREGEKLVKLTGLVAEENQIYDPGSVLLHEDAKFYPEWFCKSVGIVTFSAMYFFLLMLDAGRGIVRLHKRNVYNKIQGQPVV